MNLTYLRGLEVAELTVLMGLLILQMRTLLPFSLV